MNTPIIIVNFKIYEESIGLKGLNLARIIEHAAIERAVPVAIVPNYVNLTKTKEVVGIPVLAQHADALELGGRTGYINLEILKDLGIDGVLINHSERRLILSDIEYLISKSRALNMNSVLCTNNLSTTVAGSVLNPDFIAIEPPELIGGNVSVSKANPEIIKNAVEQSKKLNSNIKVLCGAGIKDKYDTFKAIQLGSDGILVSSGIVKSKDPLKALNLLIDGILEVKK